MLYYVAEVIYYVGLSQFLQYFSYFVQKFFYTGIDLRGKDSKRPNVNVLLELIIIFLAEIRFKPIYVNRN